MVGGRWGYLTHVLWRMATGQGFDVVIVLGKTADGRTVVAALPEFVFGQCYTPDPAPDPAVHRGSDDDALRHAAIATTRAPHRFVIEAIQKMRSHVRGVREAHSDILSKLKAASHASSSYNMSELDVTRGADQKRFICSRCHHHHRRGGGGQSSSSTGCGAPKSYIDVGKVRAHLRSTHFKSSPTDATIMSTVQHDARLLGYYDEVPLLRLYPIEDQPRALHRLSLWKPVPTRLSDVDALTTDTIVEGLCNELSKTLFFAHNGYFTSTPQSAQLVPRSDGKMWHATMRSFQLFVCRVRGTSYIGYQSFADVFAIAAFLLGGRRQSNTRRIFARNMLATLDCLLLDADEDEDDTHHGHQKEKDALLPNKRRLVTVKNVGGPVVSTSGVGRSGMMAHCRIDVSLARFHEQIREVPSLKRCLMDARQLVKLTETVVRSTLSDQERVASSSWNASRAARTLAGPRDTFIGLRRLALAAIAMSQLAFHGCSYSVLHQQRIGKTLWPHHTEAFYGDLFVLLYSGAHDSNSTPRRQQLEQLCWNRTLFWNRQHQDSNGCWPLVIRAPNHKTRKTHGPLEHHANSYCCYYSAASMLWLHCINNFTVIRSLLTRVDDGGGGRRRDEDADDRVISYRALKGTDVSAVMRRCSLMATGIPATSNSYRATAASAEGDMDLPYNILSDQSHSMGHSLQTHVGVYGPWANDRSRRASGAAVAQVIRSSVSRTGGGGALSQLGPSDGKEVEELRRTILMGPTSSPAGLLPSNGSTSNRHRRRRPPTAAAVGAVESTDCTGNTGNTADDSTGFHGSSCGRADAPGSPTNDDDPDAALLMELLGEGIPIISKSVYELWLDAHPPTVHGVLPLRFQPRTMLEAHPELQPTSAPMPGTEDSLFDGELAAHAQRSPVPVGRGAPRPYLLPSPTTSRTPVQRSSSSGYVDSAGGGVTGPFVRSRDTSGTSTSRTAGGIEPDSHGLQSELHQIRLLLRRYNLNPLIAPPTTSSAGSPGIVDLFHSSDGSDDSNYAFSYPSNDAVSSHDPDANNGTGIGTGNIQMNATHDGQQWKQDSKEKEDSTSSMDSTTSSSSVGSVAAANGANNRQIILDPPPVVVVRAPVEEFIDLTHDSSSCNSDDDGGLHDGSIVSARTVESLETTVDLTVDIEDTDNQLDDDEI